MILVKPSFEIIEIMGCHLRGLDTGHQALTLIEKAGRTCYKSEDKMTADSAIKFVSKLNDLGHESVLEHSAMMVRIICDRGVTHEQVRHRLAAYSQESTRYCNYANKDEIEVIEPFFFDPMEPAQYVIVPIPARINGTLSLVKGMEFAMNSFDVWFLTCLWTQWGYMTLINQFNRKPQEARSVLPNSLKTEIVITANFREWKHIFKLRCSKAAHPQMREIMIPLLEKCKEIIPVIFDSITY